MTRLLKAAALLAAAVPLTASAQDVRIRTSPRVQERVVMPAQIELLRSDRLMLGITTSTDSERADTLGLLIEDVYDDSPAAKAGLKEGDRLQSINGISLRASPGDAGYDDYEGILSRRLTREMGKVKEGDEVELRVFSGGSVRTVKITPVKSSEFMKESESFGFVRRNDDRAMLGVTISSTGSPRDTLGVFVSSVTSGGPAEKAGIIEGDRIAAVNGVSVRVAREDANDPAVGNAKANRLLRELEKLKAGDVAELVVVTAGRSRTVRVTTVKASDMPGGSGGAFFRLSPGTGGTVRRFNNGEGGVWVVPTPPTPPSPLAAPAPPAPSVAPAPFSATTRWRTRIVTI